ERDAQVQRGAAFGGVFRQRPLAAPARIQQFHLQGVCVHPSFHHRRAATRSSSCAASAVLVSGPSACSPSGPTTSSALRSDSKPLPATPTRLPAIRSTPF